MELKRFGINGIIIITRAATGKTTFLNKVKYSKQYKSEISGIFICDDINSGYTLNSLTLHLLEKDMFILGAGNALNKDLKRLIKKNNIMVCYDIESAEYVFDLLIKYSKKELNSMEKDHMKDILFFYNISSWLLTFENEFTVKIINKIAKKIYGYKYENYILSFMSNKKSFLDRYISEIEYGDLSKIMIYNEVFNYYNSKLEKNKLCEEIKVNANKIISARL